MGSKKSGKTTHGNASDGKVTVEYTTWAAMRDRCSNPKSVKYKDYGGRGIAVCDEWQNFETFRADMGNKPRGMSLERIDNNQGYSRQNCRWALPLEQARNRRGNIMLKYCGEEHNLSHWCEKLGLNRGTIGARLRASWSVERTLSTPVHFYSKMKSHAK